MSKIRNWLYHKIGWIQHYPGFGWTERIWTKAWEDIYGEDS